MFGYSLSRQNTSYTFHRFRYRELYKLRSFVKIDENVFFLIRIPYVKWVKYGCEYVSIATPCNDPACSPSNQPPFPSIRVLPTVPLGSGIHSPSQEDPPASPQPPPAGRQGTSEYLPWQRQEINENWSSTFLPIDPQHGQRFGDLNCIYGYYRGHVYPDLEWVRMNEWNEWGPQIFAEIRNMTGRLCESFVSYLS